MTKSKIYDLSFVRQQFPNIGDWAFFESAGGTFVPAAVSDRIFDYMRRNQVQPGTDYAASAEASERIDHSHKRLASMINADSTEVVVGHSTTMNVYVLANALRPSLRSGDEIVVTNLDHEANNGAWRRLEEFGIVVKEWKIDPETAGLGGAERLKTLLTDRTRLVCCTWCSNITGAINDIEEIATLTHSANALLCVDAVAYAPHRALNFKDSNVDFMLFSLYKLYGPHLGVLCGKQEHLLTLNNQNHFFFANSDLPSKLQPGGYLHETAASIEGIVEYFDAVFEHHFDDADCTTSERYRRVFELFKLHEDEISAPLMEFLNSQSSVRIFGPPIVQYSKRVPTISFVVNNRSSRKIAQTLGRQGIGIGAGDFYARRCIEALGLNAADGVVRVSMAHYNSTAEVDRLIGALSDLISTV